MKVFQQKHVKAERPLTDQHDFEFELSIDQVMIDADRLYEQKINLAAALDKLTQRQKEVVYFKYYENLSYEEISCILDISTKATYKLVARAIGELRNVYQQKISTFLLLLSISFTFSTL